MTGNDGGLHGHGHGEAPADDYIERAERKGGVMQQQQ